MLPTLPRDIHELPQEESMKARSVIGRTIVGVVQQRCYTDCGSIRMDVHFILDNGSILAPYVGELDGEYAVDFIVHKRKKEDCA